MKRLDFYFDFISPYAYLGWTQIHALADRHACEVQPVPVLFAALLAHSGTLGPAEIPLKRAYLFKDVIRTARISGVPIAPPRAHPFNPLLALRVAGAAVDTENRRRIIDALFHAVWGSGAGAETPEDLARVLGAAGVDAGPLLEAATRDDAKRRLREATGAAIARGVFGVPSMIVDGELFWGVDSFPHLERFLDGRDPAADVDMDVYLRVAPSVRRR